MISVMLTVALLTEQSRIEESEVGPVVNNTGHKEMLVCFSSSNSLNLNLMCS